jgi:glycosyl transferase family 25
MRIHVINLESRPDRLARFMAWNGQGDIDITVVSAVDGHTLSTDQVERSGLAKSTGFTPGALGCAQSHRSLWEACVASGEPMIIAEDDACLRGDFVKHVTEMTEGLASDFDVLFLGFNTDARLAIQSPDGLRSLIDFDPSSQRSDGYFDQFARLRGPAPTCLRVFQRWGNLCYALTPHGASKLLKACFPLAKDLEVYIYGLNKRMPVYGVDGMINRAIQREPIDSYIAFPPLAVGPNDHTSSDVQKGR